MDVSIIWVILSSLGSLVIAIILGIASYFVKRYISSNDKMKIDYYKRMGDMSVTVLEIKNLIETQNMRYENKFSCIDGKIVYLDKKVNEHDIRIDNVEKEILKK